MRRVDGIAEALKLSFVEDITLAASTQGDHPVVAVPAGLPLYLVDLFRPIATF